MSKPSDNNKAEVSEDENGLDKILDELDNCLEYLDENVNGLTRETAKDFLTKPKKYREMLTSLIKLHKLHGLVMGFHPEEIYSTETSQKSGGAETIYNMPLFKSEETTRLINFASKIFQHWAKIARKGSYMVTRRMCFEWLTGNSDTCPLSFQTAVTRILENCNELLPYLKYQKLMSFEKGRVQAKKRKGLARELPMER